MVGSEARLRLPVIVGFRCVPTSALGHEQTSCHLRLMSVIPLKADIRQCGLHVGLVPLADLQSLTIMDILGADCVSLTRGRGRCSEWVLEEAPDSVQIGASQNGGSAA